MTAFSFKLGRLKATIFLIPVINKFTGHHHSYTIDNSIYSQIKDIIDFETF